MSKTKDKPNIFLVMAIIIALVIIVLLLIYIFGLNKSIFLKGNSINKNFTFLLEDEAEEINSYDIFQNQVEINKKIKDNYDKGNYSLSNPYIEVDPYGISPQTALVMFKTSKKEKITITLRGKHNDDLITTFESSKDHFIPIYGLYSGYDNSILIETESGNKCEVNITTKDMPLKGDVVVKENNITNSNGNFYFATSAIGSPTIAYDNYGEIRWHLNIDYAKGFTFLKNGNMLLANIGIGPEINSQSGLVEIDLFGYVHH